MPDIKCLIIMLSLTHSSSYAQDISEKYASVKKVVTEINNDKTLTNVVMTNDEFLSNRTDGGNELTGYYNGRELRKITIKNGLSDAIETFDYYFYNGTLVFIYEVRNGFVYDVKNQKYDYTKTEINFIGRYYFNKNKLIDSETTGHNRFEDDTIDMESTLLGEVNSVSKKLEEKLR
jgi:hypothetical protein